MENTQSTLDSHTFVAGLMRTGWTPETLMQAHESGAFDQALKFTQGTLKIIPSGSIRDYTILVDQESPLSLPEGFTATPEAEEIGRDRFNLREMEQWLHPDQKNNGPLNGEPVLTILRESGLLPRCLGIREWDAIARAGVHIFRLFFLGQVLYCWRGLAWDREGHLRVPCLFDGVDRVGKGWHRISGSRMFGAKMPALLFPENVPA